MPGVRSEEIDRGIAAVARDRQKGATQLAGDAVDLLARIAGDEKLPDDAFEQTFRRAARELGRARPSMASLLHAAGTMLADWMEAGGEGSGRAGREAVLQAATRWRAKREADASVIADHAAEILSGAVITLSCSSTVLRALRACWERGVLTGAIVAESRPGFEGRRTASALAEAGIPVALITDAAMGVFVSTAQAAVVGADSILPSGHLVNKAGTNLLALAARRARIPFYVLAETHKVLPAGLAAPFSLEEKDPSEVLPEPIPGVAVRNVYFDITTARYVTGYITERGLLDRKDVADLARRAPGLVLDDGSAQNRSEDT